MALALGKGGVSAKGFADPPHPIWLRHNLAYMISIECGERQVSARIRSGFTWIAQRVVIAIIAILTAMLSTPKTRLGRP